MYSGCLNLKLDNLTCRINKRACFYRFTFQYPRPNDCNILGYDPEWFNKAVA